MTANTSYKQNGVPVSIPSGSYGIAPLTVHQYEYPKGHPCHNCPYTLRTSVPSCMFPTRRDGNTSRSALCCSAVFTRHDTRLTRQRKSSLYGSMVAGSIVLKAKSLHLPKDAFSADFLINDLERSNLY